MSDDDYMKDPMAKTVAGFIEGLRILAKYMDGGEQESFFCGAEHDKLYIYVDVDVCCPDSEDGIRLQRLGFHTSEADNWAYFT